MLTLAHAGRPLAPHDVWTAWDGDPVLLLTLTLLAVMYWRGYRQRPRSSAAVRRARRFTAGCAVVVLALASPIEALSGALASAHMVQHLLLTLAAAPLLALAAPAGVLLAGTPRGVRPGFAVLHRGVQRTAGALGPGPRILLVWVAHALALWVWHAAVLYDAALQEPVVHSVEHATFLVTAVLFWRLVLLVPGTRGISPGLAVLLVFTMALQSALLAVLLTFATSPWYAAYAGTTAGWGLSSLGDQQLAGAIMWVPASFVYLAAALTMLVGWLGDQEDGDTARVSVLAAPEA